MSVVASERGDAGGLRRTFFRCVLGSALVHALIVWLHLAFGFKSTRLPEIAGWAKGFAHGTRPMDGVLHWPWVLSQHPRASAVVYFALTGTLWILFFGALSALRRGARVGVSSVLVAGAALAMLHGGSLPTLSWDVFAYLTIGQATDAGAPDPYRLERGELLSLPAFALSPRIKGGSIYGPLANRAFQAMHVRGLDLYGNLIVVRTVFIASFVAAAFLLAGALRARFGDTAETRAQVAFFALSPLVIFELSWNVHVDALAILLVTAGLSLLVHGRTFLGSVLVGGLVSIRVSFAYLWAALSAFAVRSREGAAGWIRVLAFLAACVAFFLVWLLPSWWRSNPLGPVSTLTGLDGVTLSFALKTAVRELGYRGRIVTWAMAASFAIVVVWGLPRVRTVPGLLRRMSRDTLLYFLVFMPWTHPWYLSTVYPLALVSGSRRHVRALAVASAGMSCGFYGIPLGAGGWSIPVKLAIYAVGLLPASIVLLWPSDRTESPGRGSSAAGEAADDAVHPIS